MIYFIQSAQHNVMYGQFPKSFDVGNNLFETFSGEMQSFSEPNIWYLVVQLVILTHELSPLEGLNQTNTLVREVNLLWLVLVSFG